MTTFSGASKKALNKKKAKGAVLKLIHGLSPTQGYMAKINLTKHPECPFYKCEEEVIHHVLRCETRVQEAQEYFMNKFRIICAVEQDQEGLLQQIWESVIYKSN